MQRNAIIAIVAAAILIVAAAAAAIVLTNNNGGGKESKGGLYALDATILDVDMGGMSSTPKMVETIEYMYKSVYGSLAKGADKLTIEDAKKDTKFWDTYCKYTSSASVGSDGKITYKTVLDEKTTVYHDVVLDGPADKLISTGTAYPTILYYVLCYKYNVEPFSAAADKNTQLINEFRSINFAGLQMSSIQTSTPDLVKYYGSDYRSSCGSLKTYEQETLAKDVKDAYDGGNHRVILMGSGTISKDYNATVNKLVTENGGTISLNTSSTIPTTFAGIEHVAILFGYGEYVDKVIQDLELRLYKVYWSAQKSTDAHKAYFEGSSGKSTSATGSGCNLCKFFGWDVSLFTGAEFDTETLLSEKPDVMIYYTNDTRTLDEKMRITS